MMKILFLTQIFFSGDGETPKAEIINPGGLGSLERDWSPVLFLPGALTSNTFVLQKHTFFCLMI